jgi:hypothetical protein
MRKFAVTYERPAKQRDPPPPPQTYTMAAMMTTAMVPIVMARHTLQLMVRGKSRVRTKIKQLCEI